MAQEVSSVSWNYFPGVVLCSGDVHFNAQPVHIDSQSLSLRIQIYSFESSHTRETSGFAQSNTLPSCTAGYF